MLLKIPFLILISLSLIGCPDGSAPARPPTKVFTPIYIYTPEGCKPKENPDCKVDWEKSYFYGVLRDDPNNQNFFEKIPVFKFLSGEGSKYKPRLVRGGDYNEIGFYDQDMIKWGNAHCEGK